MEITIKGKPKEIAALVFAVQERQSEEDAFLSARKEAWGAVSGGKRTPSNGFGRHLRS